MKYLYNCAGCSSLYSIKKSENHWFFGRRLTNKNDEAVANPVRDGSVKEANEVANDPNAPTCTDQDKLEEFMLS